MQKENVCFKCPCLEQPVRPFLSVSWLWVSGICAHLCYLVHLQRGKGQQYPPNWEETPGLLARGWAPAAEELEEAVDLITSLNKKVTHCCEYTDTSIRPLMKKRKCFLTVKEKEEQFELYMIFAHCYFTSCYMNESASLKSNSQMSSVCKTLWEEIHQQMQVMRQ